MTTTWTVDGPPVLTRDVVRGRLAIFAPVLAAALVALTMPTGSGVLAFTTSDLGGWLMGLGALIYTAAVVGPFVRAVARYGADRAEWERRSRPTTFAQGVVTSLAVPIVATTLFLHGLCEWDTLAHGAPSRLDGRVVTREVHTGKGCHQRVDIASLDRVEQLGVCIASASSWERTTVGSAVVLDVVAGSFGRAVTRVTRADGSAL